MTSDRHGPWAYQHSMEELDEVWDAYMEATVTEGHPLKGAFLPPQPGLQPYVLSQIFDLALTVADQRLERRIDAWVDGLPGTVD